MFYNAITRPKSIKTTPVALPLSLYILFITVQKYIFRLVQA